MEDPTKLDSSGNENKTEIKGNTTGDARTGDFVAGTVLASRYRIIGLVGNVLLGLAICGFYMSLAGQPIFQNRLED